MNHGNSIAISTKNIGRARRISFTRSQDIARFIAFEAERWSKKCMTNFFPLHFAWLSGTKWIARCVKATARRKTLESNRRFFLFRHSRCFSFASGWLAGWHTGFVLCLLRAKMWRHCHACSTLRYLNFIEWVRRESAEKDTRLGEGWEAFGFIYLRCWSRCFPQ